MERENERKLNLEGKKKRLELCDKLSLCNWSPSHHRKQMLLLFFLMHFLYNSLSPPTVSQLFNGTTTTIWISNDLILIFCPHKKDIRCVVPLSWSTKGRVSRAGGSPHAWVVVGLSAPDSSGAGLGPFHSKHPQEKDQWIIINFLWTLTSHLTIADVQVSLYARGIFGKTLGSHEVGFWDKWMQTSGETSKTSHAYTQVLLLKVCTYLRTPICIKFWGNISKVIEKPNYLLHVCVWDRDSNCRRIHRWLLGSKPRAWPEPRRREKKG